MSVLGLVMYFPTYLRSEMVRFPFFTFKDPDLAVNLKILRDTKKKLDSARRGQKSLILSNSMTWLDQKLPAQVLFFCNDFLAKKVRIQKKNISINSYFIYLGTMRLITQIMRYFCSV